jgi:hypothetical protein
VVVVGDFSLGHSYLAEFYCINGRDNELSELVFQGPIPGKLFLGIYFEGTFSTELFQRKPIPKF